MKYLLLRATNEAEEAERSLEEKKKFQALAKTVAATLEQIEAMEPKRKTRKFAS